MRSTRQPPALLVDRCFAVGFELLVIQMTVRIDEGQHHTKRRLLNRGPGLNLFVETHQHRLAAFN